MSFPLNRAIARGQYGCWPPLSQQPALPSIFHRTVPVFFSLLPIQRMPSNFGFGSLCIHPSLQAIWSSWVRSRIAKGPSAIPFCITSGRTESAGCSVFQGEARQMSTCRVLEPSSHIWPSGSNWHELENSLFWIIQINYYKANDVGGGVGRNVSLWKNPE